VIPFSVSVEKMGLHRKPVLAYETECPSTPAYRSLCAEIESLA